MKATRLAAIALVVMLVTGLAAVAQESVTDVVKKVQSAVVTVMTYDATGKAEGQGTGFLVDASHIVTSYHVIDGAARANVKTADGKTYTVKGLAGADAIADVARLALAAPVKGAKPLTLSKALPAVGERIVVVGSPLGLEQTASDGIVSAVRETAGLGTFLQLTAPISPGSSGSPVVNLKGEVVGVAYGILTEGQSLNFAVASRHVLALRSAHTTALGETPPRTAGKAESYLQKGIGSALEGKYEKALPHFEAATKADPENENAWMWLGVAYSDLGTYTEAVDAFKQAIRIKADYADAHYNLGVAYAELGRWSEALDCWKQAITIKRDYAEAHYNLGTAYGHLGRWSEALECYKQAIRLRPDYAKAHCGQGTAYIKLGRYTEAVDSFKQAVRIDPDDAEAQCGLGAAYGSLGKHSQAEESFKQAIRIKPDYAEAHCGLGVAYGSLGKFSEAAECFKQAIRIKPDCAEAHWGVGLFYVAQGEKGSALEEYKILKGLDTELANNLFDLIYK